MPSDERLSAPPTAPPSIAPEGDQTRKHRAISLETVQRYLPRPRTTAEVIAGLVTELVLIALLAALALTTQNDSYRWAALIVAAMKLGVNLRGLGGGGGPSGPGPVGMGLVSLAGALFARPAMSAAMLGALALGGCSGSAVHTQAVIADTTGRAANAALTATLQVYRDQQLDAATAACGHATPCADPQAARAAVLAVRGRWAPVWSAWALVGLAHAAYADQLDRCQGLVDGGVDAGDCGPQLSELLYTVATHITEVRCAVVGLGVADPLTAMGPLDCKGVGSGDPSEDGGL